MLLLYGNFFRFYGMRGIVNNTVTFYTIFSLCSNSSIKQKWITLGACRTHQKVKNRYCRSAFRSKRLEVDSANCLTEVVVGFLSFSSECWARILKKCDELLPSFLYSFTTNPYNESNRVPEQYKKKFWEELISQFPLILHVLHRKQCAQKFISFACVFVATVKFLPSRCLAKIKLHTYR
jgi:hypothetical protein